MIIESHIQYWYGEDSIQGKDESFWTKDAMERAVGQYWYRHHRDKGPAVPMPALHLSIDRMRGIVIVSDETGCLYDCDGCHPDDE